MPPLNQNEIVREYLASINMSDQIEEDIYLPNLKTWFEDIPINAQIQETKVRLPNLVQLASSTRQMIAVELANLLDYREGVVGFSWVLGEPSLTLYYINNFQQRSFEDIAFDKLIELFVTVLKLRSGIKKIDWHFEKDYLTLTYSQ